MASCLPLADVCTQGCQATNLNLSKSHLIWIQLDSRFKIIFHDIKVHQEGFGGLHLFRDRFRTKGANFFVSSKLHILTQQNSLTEPVNSLVIYVHPHPGGDFGPSTCSSYASQNLEGTISTKLPCIPPFLSQGANRNKLLLLKSGGFPASLQVKSRPVKLKVGRIFGLELSI